jgi:phospholipid/cholesterol/gamma-HCH transport system substrate-binding protein
MTWRFHLIPENRLKHVEIKIGLLVFTVILFTIASLVYVGYRKELFAKRINYYVYSSTGERLFEGMPVKFEGFRMGQITRIELNEEGKIVLTVKILKKYQQWIKNDSRVFFNQQSVIGNPYLRFTAGGKDKPPMPEDSIFILEFEGGIDEIIQRAKPVMEDLTKIVQNIRILSDDLSSDKGSFRKILSSLENVSSDLEHGEGAVPYLFKKKDSRDKVETILDKLISLEDNVNRFGDSLNTTINDKVNPILDDVSHTTRDLYLLRRKVDNTLNLSNDLLFKLNNTWPLAPSGEVKEAPELPKP